MKMLQRFWNDDAGFVVSAELILVATILVIGMVVGLNAVRNSMTSELADVALAIDSVNQSYVVRSVRGHAAATSGSEFADNTDFCQVEAGNGLTNQCIWNYAPNVAEGAQTQTQPQP